MENPRRTAEHLSRVIQRQEQLGRFTGALLPTAPAFTLEIGCGHGHFLTAYAANKPEELCVGIDLIGERIARAVRKKVRAGLNQLHFVQASAEDFFKVLPPSSKLSRIFILFPDPWPKRRHHKNRILQSVFLETLSRHAKPDSRLYFRTDDVDYFRETTAVLSHGSSSWQILEEFWPFEHETVFQQRAASFHSLVAGPRSRSAAGH